MSIRETIVPLTLRRKRLDSISLLNAKLLGAGVAQLVEQKTLNLLVVGSNPSAGTKNSLIFLAQPFYPSYSLSLWLAFTT